MILSSHAVTLAPLDFLIIASAIEAYDWPTDVQWTIAQDIRSGALLLFMMTERKFSLSRFSTRSRSKEVWRAIDRSLSRILGRRRHILDLLPIGGDE